MLLVTPWHSSIYAIMGVMDALIRLDVADLGAMADLARWLGQEDELRGRVTRLPVPPRSGEMGATADTLMVALGSGGAVTVLAAAVNTWLQTRARKSDITLWIRGPGGEAFIQASHVDAPVLVDQVLRAVDGD